MNILVVGCGKVGSQLSNELSAMGHDVAVVDHEPEHFGALSDRFSGYTVAGVAIDQDVLRRAGIESCDALAAVTDDDNTNIMVAQLANEIFHVPRVLARIYDPRRHDVFSQFGLHTICPTNLSVDAIHAMLLGRDILQNVYLDSATVSFETVGVQPKQAGVQLRELLRENDEKSGLFGLLRPDGNLVLAHAASHEQVREQDRLVYVKVID